MGKTHGLSGTRLHRIWHSMYCRCYYPKTNQYKNYGGKGIKVCDEWKSDFMAFYNWAVSNGYEENLTLDRKDNGKDYCPDNCRWATKEQQDNHRTTSKFITHNGETKTQAQWCREYNICQTTFCDRVKSGMSVKDALTKPVYKSGGFMFFTINNETKMLSDWCRDYDINYCAVYDRIKRGWSIEKALSTPVHKKKTS